jgi:hypothetical protein
VADFCLPSWVFRSSGASLRFARAWELSRLRWSWHVLRRPGGRLQPRAAFDSDPFTSAVEIRRVVAGVPDGETGAVRLGVPDDGSRRTLGQFLRRAIV